MAQVQEILTKGIERVRTEMMEEEEVAGKNEQEDEKQMPSETEKVRA